MNEEERQKIALGRYLIIAPLLEDSLERAEHASRRQAILEGMHKLPDGRMITVKERTLRRYTVAYREHGFEGLYPKKRSDRGVVRAISQEALDRAKLLKAELPQRSIAQIIAILEHEGLMAKQSTLKRHLGQEGLMKLPKTIKGGFRRFRREHRNCLWQADLKFGPYLPDPARPGRKRRTYLLAFLDDYSRLVPHAQFYWEQKLPVLEDCFKKAILKRGIPQNVFVDQGKIYVSQAFRLACARLNIRHLTARPYSPEAKGKIERFMGTVDRAFLPEIQLLKVTDLKQFNELFWAWLEEGYNHHGHSSLNNQTPAEVFATDPQAIRFAGVEQLRLAFQWEETRRVDKTGCVKLKGRLYEAGPGLAGKTVQVRLDPFAPEEIEIWAGGKLVGKAKELDFTQKRPPVQELPAAPAATSGTSFLHVLRDNQNKRRKQPYGAISFRRLGGGDEKDV